MAQTSSVPARRPHWLPLDARTELADAVTEHLRTLDGLDPDRFTLVDVIVELGVASARAQLDQVPAQLMQAAAGVAGRSCQIRLSKSELDALLRMPNLPMSVREAFCQHRPQGGRTPYGTE
jgi:hypothetical protein